MTQSLLDELIRRLEEVDKQLANQSKDIGRVRKTLKNGRKKLVESAWPVRALEKFRSDISGCGLSNEAVDVKALAQAAEKAHSAALQGFVHEFRRQLTEAAVGCNLPVGTISENITIGPFELLVDMQKQQAVLNYAKLPVVTCNTLNPAVIAQNAAKVASQLLADVDLRSLARELEEAILVVFAREKRLSRTPELRVELPTVYREMTFIRQSLKKSVTRETFQDYHVARFIVELSKLLKSDANLNSQKPFRLETAVIENAGNPRKSLFIPNDLQRGFGEGTYFQAIILRQSI